jgi:hypothetical protein
MGFDISQLDLDNIVAFAQRVVNLFAYRRNLQVRSAPECGINGTMAPSMGHSMRYCPLTLPTAANCSSQLTARRYEVTTQAGLVAPSVTVHCASQRFVLQP